jgi:hypothetical protein
VNRAAFDLLAFQCMALNLPVPVPELQFAKPRRFRFDASWSPHKLALEIDGGVFLKGGGRHTRGAGYRKDCEKGALAAIHGWRVIHCLPDDIKSGKAVNWIEQALKL